MVAVMELTWMFVLISLVSPIDLAVDTEQRRDTDERVPPRRAGELLVVEYPGQCLVRGNEVIHALLGHLLDCLLDLARTVDAPDLVEHHIGHDLIHFARVI